MDNIRLRLTQFGFIFILLISLVLLAGCFTSDTSESKDKIVVTDGTGTITRMPFELEKEAFDILNQAITNIDGSIKDVSGFDFQTVVSGANIKGIQFHFLNYQNKRIGNDNIKANVFVLIPKGKETSIVFYNNTKLITVYKTRGVNPAVEKLIEASFKKQTE